MKSIESGPYTTDNELSQYHQSGEIDVLTLRQSQFSHLSPAKDFRPFTDRFNTDMTSAHEAIFKGNQT